MRCAAFVELLATTLIAAPAFAGVYDYSTDPGEDVPGRINHVHGYSGAATTLTVNVCVDASAADFVPYVLQAIALWNNKTIAVPNCVGFCNVIDEPPVGSPPGNPGVPEATGPVDATYALLHELGHCAFGLDHTNNEHPDREHPVQVPPPVPSDYTNSYDETSIGPGADGIPGTVDDLPLPLPGTRVSHWFRPQVNDPYLPGPALVDNTTYTRVVQQLPPAPHHWPASGNRRVGVAMGYGNAQSVMYGEGSRRTTLTGFIPDDVNTVAYAEAGLDEVIGADDYTWTLAYFASCTGAQIEIQAVSQAPSVFASCANLYVGLPIAGEPTVRHYAVDSSVIPSSLWVNPDVEWTFNFILWDDFEIGNTSYWTQTVPAP